MPQVAYQRCSQEVFEAWMKQLCVDDPLIDVRAGWRFDALTQQAFMDLYKKLDVESEGGENTEELGAAPKSKSAPKAAATNACPF